MMQHIHSKHYVPIMSTSAVRSVVSVALGPLVLVAATLHLPLAHVLMWQYTP